MSAVDPNQREALIRIAASTAEAIVQTLERIAPGRVTRGDVSIVPDDTSPFAQITPGSAAAGVSYVDGATGASVFVAPPETARVLAGGMGVELDGDATDARAEVGELELSAIAEAANQMMSAAAGALGVVLGQEVEISPPTTKLIDAPATAEALFGTAPHATSTSFTVAGAPCRLIQLIPSGFVMRVARALEDLDERGPSGDGIASTAGLTETLSGIKVRVWAELGRTALPFRDALELPLGSVVELDRPVEAPVDLYVNGLRFAHGRLMVSDDERWVFCLDELLAEPTVPSLSVPVH
jgi:flagellar motor switch protein FliN/FliY